ncbi:mynd domain containing protein [Niveomyces insectorum RCEF 264]|uniref:Mynd domain containing protein n=1 Tax=Niveomyces insectorum RCEF 264 TaxID=1081102 RepID=A0A167RAL9_9HYPO|nr:mynd domain containing protein [Niveomyces insectorum RCEF 264]
MDDIPSGTSAGARMAALLDRRQQLTDQLAAAPYDLILYLRRAAIHADLGYPDLASGDAYRALLLVDEVADESFEYHDRAVEALHGYTLGRVLPDVLRRHGSLGVDDHRDKEEERNGSTAAGNGTVRPIAGRLENTEPADSRPPPSSSSSSSPAPPLSDEDVADCQALATTASVRCYQILSRSLLLCGCLRSAHTFCTRGLALAPDDRELQETRGHIGKLARRYLRSRRGSSSSSSSKSEGSEAQVDRIHTGDDGDSGIRYSPADLPDRGSVRREIYPWNTYEPDRFSAASLAFLNGKLAQAGPKCEVCATELPVLAEHDDDDDNNTSGVARPTCWQLGLFAREPIAPGEAVLREYSLLTANNRLKESTCDACGSALPDLHELAEGTAEPPVPCPDCDDIVFCDAFCCAQAQAQYHPAVCGADADTVAKDPDDPRDADEALYVLLLARALAMAAHQDRHPLDLDAVRFLWGDFRPSDAGANADAIIVGCASQAGRPPPPPPPPPAWTLPFSFAAHVAAPLHVLEKMDVDIFAGLARYDVWVCNTLYSKFRGTASARKSRRDGRPDVAAVHPLWCLANHDCAPNVTWEWGGRMVLWAREAPVAGAAFGAVCPDDNSSHDRNKNDTSTDNTASRSSGIAAGQEILNHYCDVDLPVQQRREWASGSLGGWCMCQRCQTEAAAAAAAKALQKAKNTTTAVTATPAARTGHEPDVLSRQNGTKIS